MNIVKGDLIKMALTGQFDFIAHGCNCHNVMSSGIAKTIRDVFPPAWEKDQATLKSDFNKLGNYNFAPILLDNGKYIGVINAYTQYMPSYNGEDVFQYGALEVILNKLAHRWGDKYFGLPLIGYGLAGGNKTKILGLISDFNDKLYSQGGSLTVVEYDPKAETVGGQLPI